MYRCSSFFGDVPVSIDYEYHDDTDCVEVISVWAGNTDIVTGISEEQIGNFEKVCYWHDREDWEAAP